MSARAKTLWDLIKHEKEAYLSFLHTSVGCEANEFGELKKKENTTIVVALRYKM